MGFSGGRIKGVFKMLQLEILPIENNGHHIETGIQVAVGFKKISFGNMDQKTDFFVAYCF